MTRSLRIAFPLLAIFVPWELLPPMVVLLLAFRGLHVNTANLLRVLALTFMLAPSLYNVTCWIGALRKPSGRAVAGDNVHA